ncbi:hypothetical protein [Nocardia terpenica]|uniref:Uncharacterized protein n=1 Tax=Nocardia terpenica TaxID=455432 RepID=A0A6G9Z4P6_9NOCA|nr:hypothetical protein [Nocardia terpenica]QIS19983.1 hypothetical protein F6W96_18460 [Nocardia terpenica]
MPSLVSTNSRFFVVPLCVPQVLAAETAIAAGGSLAALTTADLDQVVFPADELATVPACTTAQSGPIAWFATFNGGVPVRTVYSINLATRQVFNTAAHRAAAWTQMVLAQST